MAKNKAPKSPEDKGLIEKAKDAIDHVLHPAAGETEGENPSADSEGEASKDAEQDAEKQNDDHSEVSESGDNEMSGHPKFDKFK